MELPGLRKQEKDIEDAIFAIKQKVDWIALSFVRNSEDLIELQEIQFLQAQTNYLSLEKSVSQMKDQVAKTKITAPFDGIIDHIVADQGSNLAPGMTPVLRIVNLDQMKVSAEIPEIHLPNIKTNTSAKIYVPVINAEYNETVNSVGNFINPNNRSFRVEISINNKNGTLKPNMTAEIEVNDYSNPNAILVLSLIHI